MKGIIFNLLEDVVSDVHGPATWDLLLLEAGVSGAYSSLGNYPDEEWAGVVKTASARLGMPEGDVLRWFGRAAMPRLAQGYPHYFTSAPNLRAFVLTLNQIMHGEVRKLYPGAVCPYFDFGALESGTLEMVYRSPRRLCALVEGFIQGAADHYAEQAALTHEACMHHGAPACVFRLECAAPVAGQRAGSAAA
jgi:hypothetical protein